MLPSAVRAPLGRRARFLTAGLVAALVLTVAPAAALAETPSDAVADQPLPNVVSGLEVSQEYGYATLRWDPVPGASSYEIERVEVGLLADVVGSLPIGLPTDIVGIWEPERTIIPEKPTFADSGFEPGGRYQWRVRAVVDNLPQAFSDPVADDTLSAWGPEEFLTGFETSSASSWTSYEEQVAWTAELADSSERVRKLNLGQSTQDREVNLLVFGHPAPLGSAEEIAASPSVLFQCHVHGTERAPREACFMLMRKLAFSDDPWVLDILSNAAVLFVPSINPDGHVNGTRGNATGQDLNRDHSLLRQPETLAFAEALRDYAPDVVIDGHEFGNSATGDLPILWPRNANVAQEVHDAAQSLVLDWMAGAGAVDGWWTTPYPIGLGQETILRNTLGLKNIVGMLLEARVPAGSTRPGETASSEANQYRRVFSSLWTFVETLDYHRESLDEIHQSIAAGVERQRANVGPAFLGGSRDAPGGTPPDDPPGPGEILDPAPCGYTLTEEVYTQARDDGPPVNERLAAHGFEVLSAEGEVFVTMAQPLRGLVPLLLDPDAREGMVAGERLHDCSTFVDSGS